MSTQAPTPPKLPRPSGFKSGFLDTVSAVQFTLLLCKLLGALPNWSWWAVFTPLMVYVAAFLVALLVVTLHNSTKGK